MQKHHAMPVPLKRKEKNHAMPVPLKRKEKNHEMPSWKLCVAASCYSGERQMFSL
jgi:hypothetical protein